MDIEKRTNKKPIPNDVFLQIDNAFKSLDLTKDLSLFVIKKLKDSSIKGRAFYRIRYGRNFLYSDTIRKNTQKNHCFD